MSSLDRADNERKAAREDVPLGMPEHFDVRTCVRDFAGPGRTIIAESVVSRYATTRGMLVHVNGWTVSCQWGSSNYATGARLGRPLGYHDYSSHPPECSPDAEIAVCKHNGRLMKLGDGGFVAGWVLPAAVIRVLRAAARDDFDGIVRALSRDQRYTSRPTSGQQDQEAIS